MMRLALRLAAAGGRSSLAPIALTALAVAMGTAILLFALSFGPAIGTRYDHAAWRDTRGQDPQTAKAGLLLRKTADYWHGQLIVRMDVAALSVDAPVPPGVPAVPRAGEAFLSPALAALVAAQPASELGDRFGRMTGIIGEDGLRAPDELFAIVGRDAASLRADGAPAVEALNGTGSVPTPTNPLLQLLVIVAVIGALAPVAVFVATATRLSAARREQRLAALRLVGATPRQVAGFAAVEGLAATLPGALGGVLLFFVLRPFVAQIPLDYLTWFPAAIAPPAWEAALLLMVVQVVGVLAAVAALRRVLVSPLGVVRRERRRPLRRRRLVPLVVSIAVFAGVLGPLASSTGVGGPLLWLFGGSFFGIIVGVAIAGPWLTAAVGWILTRLARGPVALLAGRRLSDDPQSSFGAVSGVVMAVFIGSVFLSIASLAAAASPVAGSRNVLTVSVSGDGSAVKRAVRGLADIGGVQAVATLREVSVGQGDNQQSGVIADCASLVAALSVSGLQCGPGLVHLGPLGKPVTDAIVTGTFTTVGGGFLPPGRLLGEARLHVDAAAIDRYAPASAVSDAPLALPALIIDPRAVTPSGTFPVSQIAILTDGTPSAIERARTVVQVDMPGSVVWTASQVATDAAKWFVELGRVVTLGVFGAMLLAGATLAIAVITGLVERRRPFALLRLAGMPLRRLKAVLLLEAAAPLIAVAALSALLGLAVAQLLFRSFSAGFVAPDPSIVGLLTIAVAGALGVVALAMPLVDSLTGTQATRFE
jgi:hypothetical protein